MKKAVLFILVFMNLVYLHAGFPRIGNYYLGWHIEEDDIDSLAQYDFLVLDMEFQHNYPNEMEQIRAINPNIKIIAYMTCQEISWEAGTYPNHYLRYKLFSGIEDEWWLEDSEDNHLVFWPETWMINVSSLCPEVGGKKFNNYFADFVNDEVLSTGMWDGFYIDNCWRNVSWLNDDIDIDNDGYPDDSELIDESWREGMHEMLAQMRSDNPDNIFVGNGGYIYEEHLNGVLFENFADWSSWFFEINQYLKFDNQGVQPTYNFINGTADNNWTPDNYQEMRYNLTSALLGNGYFSYDFGDTDHSQFWHYDEYEVDLGEPLYDIDSISLNVLAEEDFETGSTDWHIQSSVYIDAEIINENDNYILDVSTYSSLDTWNEFLTSEDVIYFHPYSYVKVEFDYKILDREENTVFYFFARTNTGGVPEDIGYLDFGVEEELNVWHRGERSFEITDFEDFRLVYGIFQKGKIQLDNIKVYSDDGLVVYREFENGISVVNPTNYTQSVILPDTYKKIEGIQDPVHNNGEMTNSVELSPKDGIIMLRADSTDISEVEDRLVRFRINNPLRIGDEIVIESSKYEIESVSLYDVLGREVQRAETVNEGAKYICKPHLHSLSAGVYFIKAVGKEFSVSAKFLFIK